EGLVVGPGLGAVAAAEDGDPQPPLAVVGGDVLDAGGLAGAAGRQVADAHDRHGRPLGPEPLAVVEGIAQAHGGAVGDGGGPEGEPLQGGQQPVAVPADEVVVAGKGAAAHRSAGTGGGSCAGCGGGQRGSIPLLRGLSAARPDRIPRAPSAPPGE